MKNNEMKKMIYQSERKIEVLYSGKYLGYYFYILNLGTHPTAYIKIPKRHKLYKKKYNEKLKCLQFSTIRDKGIGKRGIIPFLCRDIKSECTSMDNYFDVHGSVTFTGDCLALSNTETAKGQVKLSDTGWFIGWDYAHAGDYSGYYTLLPEKTTFYENDKKWTTEEIFEDVKDMIKQIKEVE